MQINKILIILLSFGIGFSVFSYTNSYGHGLGYEVLPPVKLGDKLVSLEVTSSQYTDPKSPDRAITFSLFNLETGITIRDVTYHVIANKANQYLFEETFQASDGIIVMNFVEGDSNEISIERENQGSDFFGSLFGGSNNMVTLKGTPFKTGGLYTFKVEILTAENFSNELEEPILYDVGLSIPDRTFYNIDDPNFGSQELSLITYYDVIENFQYNPNTKSITFEMPFNWSFDNINQTSVVHEELVLPKTFGDLMVSEISAFVNGFELPQHVITIDGFSEKIRIIHLVINQNDLFDLLEKDNSQQGMSFLIKPSSENLPLQTITANGQFGIILSWEPYNIQSGKKATFSFNLLDIFLRDRPISVSYELKILHQGKEIYSQSGISSDSKEEPNKFDFVIPENVNGPITIQFENLDGNSLAKVGLPVVVNRVDSQEISIPDWVRNNAGWWSDGQIKDSDFATGIEFLIREGIIIVPTSEGSQTQEDVTIPDWVRNNAGWWSEGLISDQEFANGLQFLIKNGIISV